MKLKDDFIVSYVDDNQYLVPVGGTAFKGMLRSNSSAAAVVELLREDTSRDRVIDRMCERFDAPRDVITEDVDAVLAVLRRVGAIEE